LPDTGARHFKFIAVRNYYSDCAPSAIGTTVWGKPMIGYNQDADEDGLSPTWYGILFLAIAIAIVVAAAVLV